jgi:hypothetical protein
MAMVPYLSPAAIFATLMLAKDIRAIMKKITVEIAAARPKFCPESWNAIR